MPRLHGLGLRIANCLITSQICWSKYGARGRADTAASVFCGRGRPAAHEHADSNVIRHALYGVTGQWLGSAERVRTLTMWRGANKLVCAGVLALATILVGHRG